MENEYTHWELTTAELAGLYGKHKSCFSKSQALCGNGSYHAKLTKIQKVVDCPKCLEKLKNKV